MSARPSGSPLPSSRSGNVDNLQARKTIVEIDALEPLALETTPSIIADRVRAAIISGKFPPGMQLAEIQLAERLATSRGPVREAMQRLIQEGLLRDERHRGVFVVDLGPEDVTDIYLARSAAEHAAVGLLVRRGTAVVTPRLEAIIEAMKVAAEASDWDELADLDLRFHDTLVAATESKRLMRMFRTLMAETRMCLMRLEPNYPDLSTLVDEHTAILEALRRGDEATALSVIDEHFAAILDSMRDATASTEP
jgi:DNA-binding GntR family transcriptional regulator